MAEEKPTLIAYGRSWPLDEIPQVNVRITFSLPDRERLEELRTDISRRLEGLAGIEDVEIKLDEAVLMQIPEPERTEYHRLMDEAFQASLPH